ncbi:hypothetical protein EZI54_07235 [Marinobacter halodurans]|uniref:Uncharacterized protein n=1 Tax=Marinobacter halodurans TaxID=2528979 RepID=A0ABY1ZMB3_9GAMM|nr:hypothetical protein [Marinobacter halodurans]TBW57445.1 hypothetical protein EZI54_07235 [Marinobacter halodurans]
MALTPEQVRKAYRLIRNRIGPTVDVSDEHFKEHFSSVMKGEIPSSPAYRQDLLRDDRFKTLVQRDSRFNAHETANQLIGRGDAIGLRVLNNNSTVAPSTVQLNNQLKQAVKTKEWNCAFELCRQGADKSQLSMKERSEMEANTGAAVDHPLEDLAGMHTAELAGRVQDNGSLTTNVQRVARALHDPADMSGSVDEIAQTLLGSQQSHKLDLLQAQASSPIDASKSALQTQRNLKEISKEMGMI